jgi:protein subunit release factor A
METIHLELRIGEGGTDAKLLIQDMAAIYIKTCTNHNFSQKILQ